MTPSRPAFALALLAAAAGAALSPTTASAATVREFPISTANADPQDLVQAPDGNVWAALRGPDKIARITPEGDITEFDAPAGFTDPDWVTVGPDGNLWFTGAFGGAGGVARIPPTNPAGGQGFGGLGIDSARGIVTGTGGNLWVADPGGGTPEIVPVKTDGTAAGGNIALAGYDPRGITQGPDGNFYVAGFNQNKIARVTPGGTVTEITTTGLTPYDVVGGSDGNTWYTAQATAVGLVPPTGNSFTPFTSTGGDPFGATLGADGAVWYGENH